MKRQHKAEAKALKRQRIEASGGVRPRSSVESIKDATTTHLPLNRTSNPRFQTLSIAVPASLILNAPSKELQTQLIGNIARAASIYHVDEIIVYEDQQGLLQKSKKPNAKDQQNRLQAKEEEEEEEDVHSQLTFIARILQYCECPKYLKKHFFPNIHPDLRFAGSLPLLDAPHHLRDEDESIFREAVVLPTNPNQPIIVGTSLADCGVRGSPILIDRHLLPGIRCTIKIHPSLYNKNKNPKTHTSNNNRPVIHQVVSPSTPRETDGTYWGYTVRIANSLPNVWKECPFEDDGKYDLKIGTTFHGYTHGEGIPQMVERYLKSNNEDDSNNKTQSPFRHCLIVFGGVDGGIDDMVEADETLAISREETHTLFDLWINICPFPGSKTIRVEEAVWITLAQLRPLLFPPLPLRQDQDIIMQKKESHKNEYRVISKKDDINQHTASSNPPHMDTKQQQLSNRNASFAHDSEISDESST